MSIEDTFKTLTGETDDKTVFLFLDEAEKIILEQTNRPKMIKDLEHFKMDLAVARYERNGESGESSHSEGGVSRTYRSEKEILSGIEKYRLSALARRIIDAKKET